MVIGLRDKNRFNASRPDGDARFATYVTHPTLPELLEILFGEDIGQWAVTVAPAGGVPQPTGAMVLRG